MCRLSWLPGAQALYLLIISSIGYRRHTYISSIGYRRHTYISVYTFTFPSFLSSSSYLKHLSILNMATTESSSIPYNNLTTALGMNETSAGTQKLAILSYYYPLRWTQSLTAAVGNSLVIAAIIRFKHLRTPTGTLIANLAVVDLLTACLMPLSTMVESMAHSEIWLRICITKVVLFGVTSFANILNLTLISIDRLICLTKPFWYMKHVTLPLVLTCQGITWVMIIIGGILLHTLKSNGATTIPTCIYVYLLSRENIRLFMVYPYYFFTLVTICNYIILAILVWWQGKKVIANNTSASASAIVQSRHRQLTKVTGIVVVCYLLLTLPNAVTTSLVSLQNLRICVCFVPGFVYIARGGGGGGGDSGPFGMGCVNTILKEMGPF